MTKKQLPFYNRDETLRDLAQSLQALILSIARHAIERRGGIVETNPITFEMGCTGIPPAEHDTCRQEVEDLYMSLETSTIFHLNDLTLNVSQS